MKAKELRIGNWYECHEGDKMNNTAIVQLKDIIWTNDGIGYELKHLNDRAVGVTICPEKLNPIPLTEEWLERFGFEKDDGIWEHEESMWSCEIIGDDDSFNFKKLGLDILCPNIFYVHQLQNLYYALTGEELNQNKEDESIETMSAESIEDFIVRRCSEISGKEFMSIDTISIDLACQLAEEYAKQSKKLED